MIKANELRIGNLFQDREGRICSVELITDEIDKCDILAIDGPITALPIEPISLTEEWLVKFGMEYTDGFSNSRKLYVKKHEYDMCHITYSEREGLLRISNGQQKGTTLIPHIKYVHQLQNLYFALTGEELIFKEYESKTD